VRSLYAGDTQGNLWKFDFSGNAPWSSDGVLSFEGKPLMVAMEAGGADARRQPITVQPVVGAGPDGGAIVLFGTGKFVSPEDLAHANYGVQTLYAVHDNGVAIAANAVRTQLQARTAAAVPGGPLLSIAGDAFVYGTFDRKTTSRRGWYFGARAAAQQVVHRVRRADPTPERLDAGEADDTALVLEITDRVRESIQSTLYRLLVQRRSVWR